MERFADFMVKDEKTGECFRADHLIEGKQCVCCKLAAILVEADTHVFVVVVVVVSRITSY